MIDFHKLPDECERAYLWRVGTAIENGTAGVTWEEAAPLINAEWREDESKYRTASAYRKPVQYAIPFYEEVFSKMENAEYSKQIQQQKDELYKIKRQVYDQRREHNKLLAIDARAEHLLKEIIRCADEMNKQVPLTFTTPISATEKEAVICLADIHYGMVTDNIWNQYNVEICKQRLQTVISKMCAQLKEHKPSKIHVLLLGDTAHGAIHTTARVAAEEKVCDQIMQVAELLAQAINELSHYANETLVYSTYGNHMRTIQNKKESIHEDNMEKVIPWWMNERFKDRDDITVVNSEFKEFIKLNVCGYNVCGTHGDLDNIKNLGIMLNTLFSKLYGETIDYTISADKHHLELFESFGIENILVSALCGTDDYANEHRLYSNAGQTMLIFTKEDGKLCQYNIKAESRELKHE